MPAKRRAGMSLVLPAKETIMLFDHEGFGERNAIRSAMTGNPPGGFDRAEVLRVLRSAIRRADRPREQARTA